MSRLIAVLVFCPFLLAQTQQQQTPSPFRSAPQATPAQLENFPPELLNELESIKLSALADDYAFHQVAHLTDNIGPRPSGSPQAKAAVDYVAEELRKLGLDVQLEEAKVPHWVRGAETAELTEYAGQPLVPRRKSCSPHWVEAHRHPLTA
jgi:hypothetical protein